MLKCETINPTDKCECGHSYKDHYRNGCKECDLQAAYGGNDQCSGFRLDKKPKVVKIKKESTAQKLENLEKRVSHIEKKFGIVR